jgi:hypothetical protein
MHALLSRKLSRGAFRSLVWDCRAILLAVFLAGAGSATSFASEDQPDPQREDKQEQAQLREYLPILLQKTRLENEREQVRFLEEAFKLSKVLIEAGETTPVRVGEVERELLEARNRVLQREADYHDSLDQFNLRFKGNAKRLQQFEEANVLPLQRHLEQFHKVSTDFQKVLDELDKSGAAEKAPKLREGSHALFASAALLKDTNFQTRSETQWRAWEKLSADELRKRLTSFGEERRRLLDRKTDLETKDQALSTADRRRLDELNVEIDLGHFEEVLREYESQPWKNLPTPEGRQREQQRIFRRFQNQFIGVLIEALNERLVRLHDRWPTLPVLRVENVDLVTGDREKAEQVLASLLKKPEAAAAGKRKFRQVRVQAEVYRNQQRLFELSCLQSLEASNSLSRAPLPVEDLPQPGVTDLVQQMLNAQRSLTRVKSQLYSTWINYQITCLDLYSDLKLTPP